MKFTNTIGIDVSKMTFDATIYSGQFYCQFTNSNKGFKQLLKWAERHTDESLKTTLFCFEHTGLYSQNLSTFLSKMKVSYSMVSGLALKRSVGLKRGKTDKIDSKVIAEYRVTRHELRVRKKTQTSPFYLPWRNGFGASKVDEFAKKNGKAKSRL